MKSLQELWSDTINYLKDPALVRSIQEFLLVDQLTVEVKGCSSIELADGEGLSSSCSSSDDSGEDSQSEASGRNAENKEDEEGKMKNRSSSSLQGSLKWLGSKTKVRQQHRIHTPPPHSSSCHSYSFSNALSTPEESKDSLEVFVVETNTFIDFYFRLLTETGYETFYIIFFAVFCWNVDIVLIRRVIIMWAMSMYIGQAIKHLFKIKRPASPPAIRLEDNPTLETEYGFPSTHATVGVAIPFSLLYFCVGRYEVRRSASF